MPKNAETTCFNVRTAFFGWVSIYFGIEYSSVCAIIGANGSDRRGLKGCGTSEHCFYCGVVKIRPFNVSDWGSR